jgi:hypothetical protein
MPQSDSANLYFERIRGSLSWERERLPLSLDHFRWATEEALV